MKRILRSTISLLVTIACVHAPPPNVEPKPVVVRASVGHTWDATMQVLQVQNLPITATEREAGRISGELDSLPSFSALGMVADCGRALGKTLPPRRLAYQVAIHGDSSHSTISVHADWKYVASNKNRSDWLCGSTGKWENKIVDQIREKAETRR